MAWLLSPAHHRWLEAETDRLLRFGRASRVPEGGFGVLDGTGALVVGRPAELWTTCRVTYAYSLGSLLGRPGTGPLVDHGLAALTGRFRDDEFGGWFASVGPEGPSDTTKGAYAHAFLVLCASAAVTARRPGAEELLRQALSVSSARFWDESAGMVAESWDRAFTTLEPYRGVNANMHTVEAYLAAADALGDRLWLERAFRITERVVHSFARENGWRLPEHFDESWKPLFDYHAETPAHPFRPYGSTVGHWMEWARLTLQVAAALRAVEATVPGWMLDDAVGLFDRAVADGWAVDGAPGFVYTVNWDGRPVVRERMHWVHCEALAAAAALYAVTGDERYDDWYRTWWDYVARYLIDDQDGGWLHELGPDNEVSQLVWSGRADIYHAMQATLAPRLPLAPTTAVALAAGKIG